MTDSWAGMITICEVKDNMKLTLLQFIMLTFVFGWVAGQLLQAPYKTCLGLGLFIALLNAYTYDAHKLLWAFILNTLKRHNH